MEARLLKTLARKPADVEYVETFLADKNVRVQAYNSFSLRETRDAIQKGSPVFVKFDTSSALFVGEGDGFLVMLKADGVTVNLADKNLQGIWPGSKAMVLADKEDETACEPVIFAPESDTWEEEKFPIKTKAIRIIQRLKEVPYCELPTYPVVCYFREPGKEEKKQTIRSENQGATITIFDPSDPVTEFFHEMGHAFWKCRVNKDEQAQFKKLFEKMDKDDKGLPAIFFDRYSYQTTEEAFCTLYLWHLKSRVLNGGYGKILAESFPDGAHFLCAVFERNKRDAEAETQWKRNVGHGAVYYNYLLDKATTFKTSDGRIMKAKVTHLQSPGIPKLEVIPPSVAYTVIHREKGRESVRVESGPLVGAVLCLRKGRIDWTDQRNDLQKARKGYLPVTVTALRKGKPVQFLSWRTKEKIDEMQAISQTVRQKTEASKTWLQKAMQTLGLVNR